MVVRQASYASTRRIRVPCPLPVLRGLGPRRATCFGYRASEEFDSLIPDQFRGTRMKKHTLKERNIRAIVEWQSRDITCLSAVQKCGE